MNVEFLKLILRKPREEQEQVSLRGCLRRIASHSEIYQGENLFKKF